eukprot:126164-Prorocentrum_minimum.AAC.2
MNTIPRPPTTPNTTTLYHTRRSLLAQHTRSLHQQQHSSQKRLSPPKLRVSWGSSPSRRPSPSARCATASSRWAPRVRRRRRPRCWPAQPCPCPGGAPARARPRCPSPRVSAACARRPPARPCSRANKQERLDASPPGRHPSARRSDSLGK